MPFEHPGPAERHLGQDRGVSNQLTGFEALMEQKTHAEETLVVETDAVQAAKMHVNQCLLALDEAFEQLSEEGDYDMRLKAWKDAIEVHDRVVIHTRRALLHVESKEANSAELKGEGPMQQRQEDSTSGHLGEGESLGYLSM